MVNIKEEQEEKVEPKKKVRIYESIGDIYVSKYWN